MASNSEVIANKELVETPIVTPTPVIQQVSSGKQKVLPVVYIQAPTPKTNIITTTNNVINMSQIQLQTNLSPQSLLLGKQPIVLQKTQNVPKNGVTYLTMLKPVSKPSDTILANSKLTTISTIKHDAFAKKPPAPSKIVISPMPKVTSNRLPVTATINTVQPKISFMPASSSSSVVVSSRCEEVVQTVSQDIGKNPVVESENNRKASSNDDTENVSVLVQQGVSILKRSYSNNGKESFETSSSTNVPIVSDAAVKAEAEEVKKETSVQPQKRSRKSTLCLRKDYHEIETIEEGPVRKVPKLENPDENNADMEVDYINNIEARMADWTFNFDETFGDLLTWDDGIGSLPGSDLKFFVNEFGFLEYLTKYEYRRMSYKKQLKQAKETVKTANQEEMRCLECGCFGMASEFINPKFCSAECQSAYEKKSRKPEVKKLSNSSSVGSQNSTNTAVRKKSITENGDSKHETSDEEGADNQEVNLKDRHPWNTKKGFSWPKYLSHVNAVSAPERLFKDPFPYNRNGFRPGMKLEGIDPHNPSQFCVFTVAAVQGYRLQLHFDGYPPSYDFWINADSMDIFPVGFCEKNGRNLKTPPKIKNWNWNSYLKYTKSPAAPKHLFSNRTGHTIFPSGFRIGMKLEAVDKKHSSLICVATVRDLLDYRLLVHFDSWDDIYDYWADPGSPYIHPIGWCEKNRKKLTPPHGYPDKRNFSWDKYLTHTCSQGAPVRAFKLRPASGFKKGMRLECVDKRVPQLVRVATVDEIRNHRLRISFDGWPDRYSYWVDDDSPDIHPAGWCQKTGHPLEPPLTPGDVYDSYGCPTIGCKGVGHTKGPLYSSHFLPKHCPYAEENLEPDDDRPDKPQRILRRPMTELMATKSKGNDTINLAKKYVTNDTKTEWLESLEEEQHEQQKAKIKQHLKHSFSEALRKNRKANHFRSMAEVEVKPQDQKIRDRRVKYLEQYVKSATNKSDPKEWTYEQVTNFVTSLPFLKECRRVFTDNRIDGESFLMLSQDDLVEIMNLKLGPAIALYNCILLLRTKSTPNYALEET